MGRTASESGRRALNLGVSAELVEDARKVGVNLSALLERALIAELAHLRRLQWRAENAQAVSAYNEHLILHGTCFEGRWGD
jgi:antitoxin CcdA